MSAHVATETLSAPATRRLTAAQREQAATLNRLGMPMPEIAALFATNYDHLERMLRDHRRAFLSGRSEHAFEIREDRLIQWRKRSRPDGGFDLRPISLPCISMHIAALQEKSSG